MHIIVILFGILFGVVGFAIGQFIIRNRNALYQKLIPQPDWQSATGTVVKSVRGERFDSDPEGGKTRVVFSDIDFQFPVNGTGMTVNLSNVWAFLQTQGVDELLKKYPLGMHLEMWIPSHDARLAYPKNEVLPVPQHRIIKLTSALMVFFGAMLCLVGLFIMMT